jgi:Fic family protein
MSDYKWHPIEPLSDQDLSVDLAGNQSLYESWRSAKRRLKALGSNQVEEFTRKLIRRLSVETGILERLYDLDRGTTEALVQKGFAENLIAHTDTNIPPATLIEYLQDQEAAIQLVMDVIGQSRPLSKGLLHELHAILTRHQETTSAIDQFGNRLEIPLLRGKFKEHPNNPRRPDGSTHEYCPPVHVDSEIDRLLELFNSYFEKDPVVVAAWLHHRFTQIHPYQDGNGRLARVIVTMVLVQHDLLPVVLDRDIRVEYIDALERADSGDATFLIRIFARLERNAILQALSVNPEAEISHQQSLTSAVIGSLADKFNRRKQNRDAELLKVNDKALALRETAHSFILDKLMNLKEELEGADLRNRSISQVFVIDGGPENDRSHWYRTDVIRTAQATQQFVNFDQNHYFTQGTIRLGGDKLKFIVSFHHVGVVLNGIMEATAFAKLQFNGDPDDSESAGEVFLPCSIEPFAFTYITEIKDVQSAFSSWLDASLAISLKEFGDRL